MNKATLYKEAAREKLLSGINKIADAVAVTMGPKGRNVLIGRNIQENYGTVALPNVVTKDGYRVTTYFDVTDFFERTGVNAVKEAAYRSVSQSGDGTTTTVVMMRHMVQEGLKEVDAGANPIELKREVDIAVTRVVSILKTRATQVDQDNEKVFQVATIAANNDPEMGRMIADAFKRIGHEGVVDIAPGKSVYTEIKMASGYRLENGFIDPLFINRPERQMVELENPMILLYNRVITHHKQIFNALQEVTKAQRSVLIVCPDAQEEGFAFLSYNNRGGNLKCCVVKTPGIGDAQRIEMEDLAVVTGATFMADNRGTDITKIEPRHFGSARKVIITNEETMIIEGNSDQKALLKLLDELRLAKAAAKNEDEAAPIEKRIAKLMGGVAVIQVGAATETEQKEKMDRFDDAVRAVKSAIAEGYTVGAGTAFLRIRSGNKIVDSAMDMVLKQILANAGIRPRKWWQIWKPKDIFAQVKAASGNIGYNAKSGKIEDLIEAGVIDPVKVQRCALQNAASSATMILTTEAAIVDTF